MKNLEKNIYLSKEITGEKNVHNIIIESMQDLEGIKNKNK